MVRAKKHLGQHFLNDEQIAKDIVGLLSGEGYEQILEIGPGTGVLTQFLVQKTDKSLSLIDIDHESILFLQKDYPELEAAGKIIEGDFLQMSHEALFGQAPVAIIGNFPYNISSQIFFKVLESYQYIPEVVCMLQKEVAERIASAPGNKDYGILSVLLQAYYDIRYAFTVEPEVFIPPPKVRSGVIILQRNATKVLDCDEKLFKQVVKQAFNQRRKTLRNALKGLQGAEKLQAEPLLELRAERLSVADYVYLTKCISQARQKN